MTGSYLRIKRNGKYVTIESEFMTIKESKHFFKGKTKAELFRWLELYRTTLRQEFTP